MTDLCCPCSPESTLVRAGQILRCVRCGSFCDLTTVSRHDPVNKHFHIATDRLVLRALQDWLHRTGLDWEIGSTVVCDVGFDGAVCVDWLHCAASRAFGIAAGIDAMLRAAAMGLPAGDLFVANMLPAQMPEPVDLWLFRDSFEHLPDPAAFCRWMDLNSSPRARLLIVGPQANSLSERLLGQWWPHRRAESRFHWSRRGLSDFLGRFGYAVERRFWPWKLVSPRTLPWLTLAFNIGEMGLVLRRRNDVP